MKILNRKDGKKLTQKQKVRILCTGFAVLMLAIPTVSHLHEKNIEKEFNNKVRNEQMVANDLVFVIESPWDNYDVERIDGSLMRNYRRTVRRIEPKETFNPEDFNNDYVELLEYVKKNNDLSNYFEIIEEKEETINVNFDEKASVDDRFMHLRVEGTDIEVVVGTNDYYQTLIFIIAVLGLFYGGMKLFNKVEKKHEEMKRLEKVMQDGFKRDGDWMLY